MRDAVGSIECKKCGRSWNGLVTAHCAGECHRTFTDIKAFDKHRKAGRCLDPLSVGLRDAGREYPCWEIDK